MVRVGRLPGVGRPVRAVATTLLVRTIVGIATATVTTTAIVATPATAPAALTGKAWPRVTFSRPPTPPRRNTDLGLSDRDRDTKDDRERDRDDRDRRENGANGDDRKRMFSLVLRNKEDVI